MGRIALNKVAEMEKKNHSERLPDERWRGWRGWRGRVCRLPDLENSTGCIGARNLEISLGAGIGSGCGDDKIIWGQRSVWCSGIICQHPSPETELLLKVWPCDLCSGLASSGTGIPWEAKFLTSAAFQTMLFIFLLLCVSVPVSPGQACVFFPLTQLYHQVFHGYT